MKITELGLPGVLRIEPAVFSDPRGFFLETWNERRYRQQGFPETAFVQDNHSRSTRGVLRGLHYQLEYPQGKLVQVTHGRIWDVAVDIRVGSPTYGAWAAEELSDENHLQLWVPPGFAHGFCVLSEFADVTYKCTDHYRANDDAGIAWNDSTLGIDWPVEEPVLSEKDRALPVLETARRAGKLPVYSQ